MIHRAKQWLTVEELQNLVAAQRQLVPGGSAPSPESSTNPTDRLGPNEVHDNDRSAEIASNYEQAIVSTLQGTELRDQSIIVGASKGNRPIGYSD